MYINGQLTQQLESNDVLTNQARGTLVFERGFATYETQRHDCANRWTFRFFHSCSDFVNLELGSVFIRRAFRALNELTQSEVMSTELTELTNHNLW